MDEGWLWSFRMLEEGKVDETDKKKDEIEEHQRERRKELNKMGEEHVPRFFKWALFLLLAPIPFMFTCIYLKQRWLSSLGNPKIPVEGMYG